MPYVSTNIEKLIINAGSSGYRCDFDRLYARVFHRLTNRDKKSVFPPSLLDGKKKSKTKKTIYT